MSKGERIGILVKRFPKVSETFIANEILELERRGEDLTVFTLFPPSDSQDLFSGPKPRATVVQLNRLSMAKLARAMFASPWQTIRAWWAAVQSFGWNWTTPFATGLTLSQSLKDANIAHLHAHFADDPSGIAQIAAIHRQKTFSISAHAKDIYTTAPKPLARRLLSAAFTVTCTQSNAEYLRSIAPAARIERVYHGINVDALKRSTPNDTETPIRIVSVGRLRPKKGMDVLIDACAQLRAQGQEFVCEIIGYGPEEDRLKQSVRDLKLTDRVLFLGKCTHSEVIAKLNEASLFVLPCRIDEDGDRDGIPNAMLEALAMEVPVISTRVSGIPEVIVDGENGVLIEPDDAFGLAQAMLRVLKDPALATSLSRRGREDVCERFSLGHELGSLQQNFRAAGQKSVAYILKGFPRLSESFITNEIRILDSMGAQLTIFSIKPGDALGQAAAKDLRAPVLYLPPVPSLSATTLVKWLPRALPAYSRALGALAVAHPLRFTRTLLRAFIYAWRYRKPKSRELRKVFIKEFIQAAWIANQIRQQKQIGHLHGHFCHGAATVAWFVSDLTGLGFSFTAHAKDIYERDLNPGDLLEKKMGRASFVVTCTESNHAHLTQRAKESRQIETIYHGLDTQLFRPVAAQNGEGFPPLILGVGRLVEKKGFADLVRAAALLKQRGYRFRCQIVGEDGDAAHDLRSLITDLGLGHQFQFRAPVAQADLPSVYAQASIFALPCRITASGDRDGIPNVLAEAMAMGLPVVSTDVSGIPEIIRSGENGITVPPDRPDALADALASLLDDAGLRAGLGQRARSTIEAVFDSSKTTKNLHTLFASALARKGEMA